MKLRVFKSTQESLLYFLLVILIIGNITLLVVMDVNTKAVKRNQAINAGAIKDYIACLLTLKQGPGLDIQEQTCFDDAPQVK